MRLRVLYVSVLLYWLVGPVHSSCPARCTCSFHGRIDGAALRTVLCNDPDTSLIPVNVPVDAVKLRVERTAVRRVPATAFYYLSELRYLWLTYNSISYVDPGSFYNLKVLHELRLDGNMISYFPWESLKEMPRLRTLDLHNNRLHNIPTDAIQYLTKITYLDISSNRLQTLPTGAGAAPGLFDLWPPYNGMPVTSNTSQKIVLGVQDNPWQCDCRLSKLLEISKMTDTPVILMDRVLLCVEPEHLSGVLFQRVELDQCVKPTIMVSAKKLTSILGSNVLLRCDATGLPNPNLVWTTSDGALVNNTMQESPSEGVQWSIMSINGIQATDAGNYSCTAKNFAGKAFATITVEIAGTETTTIIPTTVSSGTASADQTGPTATGGTLSDVSTSPSSTTTPLPPTTSTTTPSTTQPAPPPPPPPTPAPRPPPPKKKPIEVQKGPLAVPTKVQQGENGRKLAADEKSQRIDASKSLRDLSIVEETANSAVLLWTVDGMPSDSPLTVVYSPYGDEDSKDTVETTAGTGKVLLEGLMSGLQYSVCLVATNTVGKDPCVDFYTLHVVEVEDHQGLILIMGTAACIVVLPLIALLLYKILGLYNQSGSSPPDPEELQNDSYVTFETITMKQRAMNSNSHPTTAHGPIAMWPRRPTQTESDRLMLCSRSSIDSHSTYKSDSSRSEFLC